MALCATRAQVDYTNIVDLPCNPDQEGVTPFISLLSSPHLHCLLESNPVDWYVPKLKCPVLMCMAYEYCGILKSWLKPLLNKLKVRVYSMKTNNHQKQKRYHTQGFQWHTRKFTFTFQHKEKRCNLVQLLCVMRSESNKMQAMQVHFDTDFKPIKVDNHASASMSPYLEDFINVPVPVQKKVNGILGSLHDI